MQDTEGIVETWKETVKYVSIEFKGGNQLGYYNVDTITVRTICNCKVLEIYFETKNIRDCISIPYENIEVIHTTIDKQKACDVYNQKLAHNESLSPKTKDENYLVKLEDLN